MVNRFDLLLDEVGRLCGQLERIDDTLVEGFKLVNSSLVSGFSQIDTALQEGFASVVTELEQMTAVMIDQRDSLYRIESILRRPYDTQVRELLGEAKKWLDQGERSEGREQQENRKDALRLFRDVVENKIGQQNYVAWFNIGYLQWLYSQEQQDTDLSFRDQWLKEAEESFYRAQRLSAPEPNSVHTKCLRHLAQVKYELGKPEEAYQLMKKALAVKREYRSLHDAARYASVTARKEEMVSLLAECIEIRPTTIVTMYGEQDFLSEP